MFCSITGQVPEQPVVSTKSGLVFERRLVEKFLREKSTCPITGEPLSVDDLLPLKTNKAIKPRTAPATSIPGLLSIFHDEWDALMLETHTLRQHLNDVRQELCHALYQQDAATRVIARLIRERDDARGALENAHATLVAEATAKRAAAAAAAEPAAKKARTPAIPEEVLQELTEVNVTLSKSRKKREVPKGQASPDEVARLNLLASAPLHKTTQGGIEAVDIHPENSAVVATAGADSTIQLYDYKATRLVASMEGHAKRVTGVQFVTGGVLLSSSADKTARIWRQDAEGGYACAAVLRDHQAEVVGVTVHPSKKYAVTASADASWCFYDLATATCLKQVAEENMREAYTAVQFHPDGLILGAATEANMIRIWEVKAQKNVASFGEHTSPVRSLAFSENGYYLASGAEDAVKLWDLRKLKVLKSFSPYEGSPAACHAVSFDFTGQFLAVGGPDVHIYNSKQDWNVVRTLSDMPKKGVHSLRWGENARTLVVGAADHNLRVFGLTA
mmetsp:Transcript_2602/g.4424  ORF Transcript_2602/g.4424 Transcript_2602/m.4424 type:complete len:504 (+) Transcript_2602:171-1682(+)|eukprot:CAMPEP_0119106930 /NCGR_PEP_ID=MMETSP1180-20130426/7468_1 /TAXON_ID=3052 ORGANISM="Chlamydomonas cf sp, Strain CCMP681" /NCGR_SAMPLE_ID=MMETSP1180 /ASSEMBLY_ACC=CAM_ASM_000741 /LENGTH=503 /DNA_ID=CAMNT_0007092341 /DNA_START=150 /DNA_END=1661 /DNA_ORIENTATION=+